MSRARDHFTTIVRPTAKEFLSDVRDVRRGFLAAIVLYHMADYLDWESNPTQNSSKTLLLRRQALISKCPEFAIIRDVADASKHAQLRPATPPRDPSSSDQITQSFVLFRAPFGESAFEEAAAAGVLVTLEDGKSMPLAGLVQAVLSMWEDQLR
jgi:hypothetical protein